jgi:hypothetical protein
VDTWSRLFDFDHLRSNGPLDRRSFLYGAEGTEYLIAGKSS